MTDEAIRQRLVLPFGERNAHHIDLALLVESVELNGDELSAKLKRADSAKECRRIFNEIGPSDMPRIFFCIKRAYMLLSEGKG